MKKQKLIHKVVAGHPIEKPLTIAGLLLVGLGAFSSIFYAYINRSFIEQSLFSSIYYMHYLILLGGGFAIGFALTKKPSHKLFSGVVYALLAFSLYTFTDIIRSIIDRITGRLAYPFGLIIFESSALFTLLLTFIVALFVQLRPKNQNVGQFTKLLFIVTFAIAVAYPLAQVIYFTLTPESGAVTQSMPVGFVILNFLTNPFVITAVAYALLSRVTPRFDRLFYASFVGAFAHILMLVLWNFRTEAYDPTNRFEASAMIIVFIVIATVLWRTRVYIAKNH